MEISIISQLKTLGYSVIFGAYVSLLYELIRILRVTIYKELDGKNKARLKRIRFLNTEKKPKGKRLIKELLDIGFFIYVTPLFAVFLHTVNNGIIRGYILIAVTLGHLIYILSVKRITSKLIMPVSFAIIVAFGFIAFVIKAPIKWVIKRIKAKRVKRRKAKEKKERENKGKVLLLYGK